MKITGLLKGILLICMPLLWIPATAQEKPFRPPAYPLITCNPYFSFWSFADHPGTDWTRHWTGSTMGMASLVKIDNQTFRLVGLACSDEVMPMPLVRSEVLPTRTIYTYDTLGCRITLSFINPMFPWDMKQLSKPVGYLNWKVESSDGSPHDVKVYFDCSAEPAIDHPSQKVNWSRLRVNGLEVLSMGSSEQAVLEKAGDDLRIDWGYFYTASPALSSVSNAIGSAGTSRKSFLSNAGLPESDDLRMPRSAMDEWPVMSWTMAFGNVTGAVENHIILAYDEGFCTEFLNRRLPPYWKLDGETTSGMLSSSEKDYQVIKSRCEQFDKDLMADLELAGGKEYSLLASLAYRQSLAAHVLATDIDGTPYHFPKENFSNGCISTVDVIYPASPILLLFNPELLKANLTPLFRYIESGKWKFPFAPHDLGTYPLANGQVYGGGERTEDNQMPVEETGNMIIMMYAIAYADGNADYSKKHFDVLKTWAKYLLDKGFDPENQLCTDDFAGHLAHNTNLSIKAIIALECYSRICEMIGNQSDSKEYHKYAKLFAQKWEKEAANESNYRLAFDKPGSWSQKYNLIWDKIFKFNLFDPSISKREQEYYKDKQNRYGLPLDNRADYTKADWLTWTATMSDDKDEFINLIHPMYLFACETPDRLPFTDWYDTKTGKKSGFQARSVIGGLFIKMLEDKTTWSKWRNYTPD
ncbi:MAG: DUF4965 domain-containing protein [Bacteroidales bacterium]|nr:DUF4965 domain-containing protein [Bacteroidales bacterium]